MIYPQDVKLADSGFVLEKVEGRLRAIKELIWDVIGDTSERPEEFNQAASKLLKAINTWMNPD